MHCCSLQNCSLERIIYFLIFHSSSPKLSDVCPSHCSKTALLPAFVISLCQVHKSHFAFHCTDSLRGICTADLSTGWGSPKPMGITLLSPLLSVLPFLVYYASSPSLCYFKQVFPVHSLLILYTQLMIIYKSRILPPPSKQWISMYIFGPNNYNQTFIINFLLYIFSRNIKCNIFPT